MKSIKNRADEEKNPCARPEKWEGGGGEKEPSKFRERDIAIEGKVSVQCHVIPVETAWGVSVRVIKQAGIIPRSAQRSTRGITFKFLRNFKTQTPARPCRWPS